jgi:protocatechuate 3,4-dioxygenase beta subunit
VPWASGGTGSITGNYPDPFVGSGGMPCTLTSAMTIGPCYANTLSRKDISDGMIGLPLRLSFLVVRANGCAPMPAATVDIWHSGVNGDYSKFASGTICNPGTEDLQGQTFCRGVQTTDANGRVDFDTIFPGWYSGRAIHIHFTVHINGDEYVTSQLFFDDALEDEIEMQSSYIARGPRNTRNTQDLFLPRDNIPAFLFSTAKRSDGVLHAWKILSLRSSLDQPLPSAGPGVAVDGGFPPGLPPPDAGTDR